MFHPVAGKSPSWFETGCKAVATLLISMAIALAATGNFSQVYFANMDKQFLDHITKHFELSGSSRLIKMRQQLLDYTSQSRENELSTLRFVNDLFNRTPQITDATHWGVEDYWATPAELVASNGGDCEDFVIAKYFALREIGVPAEKMRLTYVKASHEERIENHMVLAYYPTPEAEPLLLDNIMPQILPASKRPDLMPVYEFNGELSDRFNGPAIRKWESLIDRMHKEFSS